MRTLSFLAIAVVALANTQAGEKIPAPVPKDTPAPVSIEGKYNLVSVTTPGDRGGPGGPNVIVGPGGGAFAGRVSLNSALLTGPATITKNEITLEGSGRVSPIAAMNGPTTM